MHCSLIRFPTLWSLLWVRRSEVLRHNTVYYLVPQYPLNFLGSYSLVVTGKLNLNFRGLLGKLDYSYSKLRSRFGSRLVTVRRYPCGILLWLSSKIISTRTVSQILDAMSAGSILAPGTQGQNLDVRVLCVVAQPRLSPQGLGSQHAVQCAPGLEATAV